MTSTPNRGRNGLVASVKGLALILAPWAFVIANSGDILTTDHGLDDTTPRGALLISAAHPLADKWFTFAAMIGCLLLVPAVLGAMGLVRVKGSPTGPRSVAC